ncbi:DUF2834 domain-containing protein [Nocardia brasiliensis]|uniref:DUF2834 domain-containing protein n=1 Tax=Nocardia brasiliensis TaxID=37326 RepID=UPI003D8DC12B
MLDDTVDISWRRPVLAGSLIVALVTQSAIAVPYVLTNGPRSILDFFVGDIYVTVPGRYAMIDLAFVTLIFHIWAFGEARRLGITRWWLVSFLASFAVGIATGIPAFLVAREYALAGRSADLRRLSRSGSGRLWR